MAGLKSYAQKVTDCLEKSRQSSCITNKDSVSSGQKQRKRNENQHINTISTLQLWKNNCILNIATYREIYFAQCFSRYQGRHFASQELSSLKEKAFRFQNLGITWFQWKEVKEIWLLYLTCWDIRFHIPCQPYSTPACPLCDKGDPILQGHAHRQSWFVAIGICLLSLHDQGWSTCFYWRLQLSLAALVSCWATFGFLISLQFSSLAENFSTEVGLLQLIGDPPPEQITKIYGPDNNPGYVFGPDANTGQVARYHLPSPFYRDFSLLFHIQPTTNKAGVLFAITDSSQAVIYIGVKLSDAKEGKQHIIFYYTEPGSQSSYAAATFTVSSLLNQWTRFAVSVEDEEVVLFLDCEEYDRIRFERSPDEMELEDGSGLFVGQAGGADPDKYQVSSPKPQIMAFNKITPIKVEPSCVVGVLPCMQHQPNTSAMFWITGV